MVGSCLPFVLSLAVQLRQGNYHKFQTLSKNQNTNKIMTLVLASLMAT